MDTESRVDRLLQTLEARGLDTPAIILYGEGVKTKLCQVRLSLEHLRELEHLEDRPAVQDGSTVLSERVSVDTQVIFFCDCFWDFLRSSLDILGQLINQVLSLGIDERNVDLKRVANKLKESHQCSPIDEALDNLLKSRAFEQLEEYRHCSTHRRPIYVETKTVTTSISGTPGYYSGSSSPTTVVERYLCKNPWNLTPQVDYKRPVVRYCELLLQRIEKHMDKIINCLT